MSPFPSEPAVTPTSIGKTVLLTIDDGTTISYMYRFEIICDNGESMWQKGDLEPHLQAGEITDEEARSARIRTAAAADIIPA